jgi:hypothetical protein
MLYVVMKKMIASKKKGRYMSMQLKNIYFLFSLFSVIVYPIIQASDDVFSCKDIAIMKDNPDLEFVYLSKELREMILELARTDQEMEHQAALLDASLMIEEGFAVVPHDLADQVCGKLRTVGVNVTIAGLQVNGPSILTGTVAEGYLTTASGAYSHAEGYQTRASGNYSHAEGNGSIASNSICHAEGSSNAFGAYSHAEGLFTTANAEASHAEGFTSTANNVGSHAEGGFSNSSQTYSHAEGGFTIASGAYSHAEGYHTTASNNSSHAEGAATTASGSISHAAGQNATAAHANTFCWSDGSTFSTSAPNQFIVKATGTTGGIAGTGIVFNNNSAGAHAITSATSAIGNNATWSFVATNPSLWNGAPVTIADAINRLATYVYKGTPIN